MTTPKQEHTAAAEAMAKAGQYAQDHLAALCHAEHSLSHGGLATGPLLELRKILSDGGLPGHLALARSIVTSAAIKRLAEQHEADLRRQTVAEDASQQRRAADAVFESYDFAPFSVASSSGWTTVQGAAAPLEWSCSVFLEGEDAPAHLTVEFDPAEPTRVVSAEARFKGDSIGHWEPRSQEKATTAAITQDQVNALASQYALTPGTVESRSDGSLYVILERDDNDDRYFQVAVRQQANGALFCHIGLYGDRCIVNDGEVTESTLEAAIRNASARIERIAADLPNSPRPAG